jgi:hypothetical protein
MGNLSVEEYTILFMHRSVILGMRYAENKLYVENQNNRF